MQKETAFLEKLLARLGKTDNEFSFGDKEDLGDIYDELSVDLSTMIKKRLKQLNAYK